MDSVTQSAVSAVCANNGALILHAIAWVFGTVGVASIVANFRNRMPAPVVKVIDVLAFNFVKAIVAKAATPPQS